MENYEKFSKAVEHEAKKLEKEIPLPKGISWKLKKDIITVYKASGKITAKLSEINLRGIYDRIMQDESLNKNVLEAASTVAETMLRHIVSDTRDTENVDLSDNMSVSETKREELCHNNLLLEPADIMEVQNPNEHMIRAYGMRFHVSIVAGIREHENGEVEGIYRRRLMQEDMKAYDLTDEKIIETAIRYNRENSEITLINDMGCDDPKDNGISLRKALKKRSLPSTGYMATSKLQDPVTLLFDKERLTDIADAMGEDVLYLTIPCEFILWITPGSQQSPCIPGMEEHVITEQLRKKLLDTIKKNNPREYKTPSMSIYRFNRHTQALEPC